MNRIKQFGIMLLGVVAFLSTSAYAYNGDKAHVVVNNAKNTEIIHISILSDNVIDINSISLNSSRGSAYIKELNPIVGGINVDIEIGESVSPDDDIIIDIVGVDNITGVFVNNNNQTSTQAPTNEENNSLAGNSGNDNSGSTNYSSNEQSTVYVQIIAGKKDIQVYPNPIEDETNVVTVGEILGKQLDVVDQTGTIVFSQILTSENGNNRMTTINLSQLKTGLYILRYYGEDGTILCKKLYKK